MKKLWQIVTKVIPPDTEGRLLSIAAIFSGVGLYWCRYIFDTAGLGLYFLLRAILPVSIFLFPVTVILFVGHVGWVLIYTFEKKVVGLFGIAAISIFLVGRLSRE